MALRILLAVPVACVAVVAMWDLVTMQVKLVAISVAMVCVIYSVSKIWL